MLVRDHETAINSDRPTNFIILWIFDIFVKWVGPQEGEEDRGGVGPGRKGCPGSNRLGLGQWGEAHSWWVVTVTAIKRRSMK